MKTVLFYISGHGYGHAVRMGEVMRELRHLRPDWRILARTAAPRHMLPEDVECSAADFDSGVVEREAGVVMDEPATVARLKRLLGKWDAIVESEIGFVSENRADLIVADIPPIAGDIAYGAGVACVAISNFTWDWIYEPYAREHLTRLENAYSRMTVLLRLPFAQPKRLHVFPRIVDAPLIARRSSAPPFETQDRRTRVLMGSRAQVSEEAWKRAAFESPDVEFVIPPTGAGFPEALASCDLVIAKLGFSMLAECIASRKPLLYPPRENFREEAILQAQAAKHVPALAIPLLEFYAGNWRPYLVALRALPMVETNLLLDGAQFCARFLAQWPRE